VSIGFGIIGTGMMGGTYAEAMRAQAPHARLVAVAGGRRAAALGAEYGVPVEAAPDALLARTDIDAVVIATPHTTHLPLATAAAAAGKHVYLEKPMALSVAECDAIIGACRDAGVRLTVASQSRYNDISLRAKQLIEDGTVGKIRMFRVTSPTVGWDVPADGWFVDPDEGGAYLDWGPHGCDTLRWFTGSDATQAFGMFANFGDIPALDPTAMVSYRLASGAMAQFWMSYEIPAPGLGSYMQWLCVGEDGMLDFDRDVLRVGRGDSWTVDLDLPPWDWSVDPKAPRRTSLTARQVEQFAAAIMDDTQHDISGEDGRAAIEMCEAAIRSARTGQALAIPLEVA
jgi:UDP-N-acetyl-2-amino-2-deoxyglucuronate dehydrogenase